MQRNHLHANDSRSQHENALQQLQAELKLLQWHKLANEAALQTALMKVKALRREEAKMKPKLEETKRRKRRERLRRAREDEESKPLQLTREMKLFLEQEEERNAFADEKRYERRFDQMIQCQQMITEKETLKSRRDYCRAMQNSLNSRQGRIEYDDFELELDPKKAENYYNQENSNANEGIKIAMDRLQKVVVPNNSPPRSGRTPT